MRQDKFTYVITDISRTNDGWLSIIASNSNPTGMTRHERHITLTNGRLIIASDQTIENINGTPEVTSHKHVATIGDIRNPDISDEVRAILKLTEEGIIRFQNPTPATNVEDQMPSQRRLIADLELFKTRRRISHALR